jgi:hypothetical protein
MAKNLNLDIKKFLGLWYDDAGDTNIPVGAFSQLQNFQMLPSYKLRKRSGYTSLLDQHFFEYVGTTITIPAGRMVGDVDGNGKFTQADLDLLRDNYLQVVNAESSLELKACDINNDKQVTSSDLSPMMNRINNPYTADTYVRDLLGVWGTKYDLGVTTTDWTYYTDIAVVGMTEGDDMPIVLEGLDDIGLYPYAQRGAGFVRVFSKLLPIANRTAYYSDTMQTVGELTPSLPIRGQWYGKLNDQMFHVVAVGGKIYTVTDKYTTQVGSLTDADTNMFQFGDTLYIQNGIEYLKFSGEETIDPNPVKFDSRTASVTYPYTDTIPAGRYEIELCGGKAKDVSINYTSGVKTSYGGKGGTVKFVISLDEESDIEIKHITNGDAGDCYALYVNTVLCAVAGGGGKGARGRSGGSGNWHYYHYDGADGGGDIASGGVNNRDGKGGTQTNGGLGGIGEDGNGSNGSKYDDELTPFKGGTAYPNNYCGEGGCGYCGGGGGGLDEGSTYDSGGIGGGGSSYITKSLDITVIENSSGTNTTAGYITYQATKLYDTAVTVDGYIPTVQKGTKPDGTNGTAYEPINALTGKRKQTFNGNNSATVYKLAEKNNVSVDSVKVDGVAKTITTHYTVNTTKDEITFTSGNTPAEGIDNVEIAYTHDADVDRADVVKYTHARLYGGKNDNRVFFYGNGNRIIYSDLADGVPSVEYFPVTNTMDVGSTQYDVTGLTVQYDRMLIHKERGTWWTQYDYDTTLLMANFPVYPLNDNVGASYTGVEQVCQNNPFVLHNKQLWQFVASNVRDERNVDYLSERVQPLLDQLDFTNVKTLDYEKFGEYWIILDNRAYIYNYRMDVWFYYYFADTITTAIIKEGKVVLGTTGGDLIKMDGALDDNGTLINAFAETGWIDYGYSNMRKFLNFMWVQIFPESDTSAEIYYQIDRGALRLVKEISYKNLDFSDMDFADFSFATNYNPKSFRLKPKAKKFVYIKFSFINNKRNRLTLLGLNAPSLLGGQSK